MPVLNQRKQFLLWTAAALVASAGLLAVLVWEHRRSAPPRSAYVVGIPEKGAALFFGDKQCAVCHSVNGLGGRVAPDLTGKRPGTPAMAWLTTVLWNHAPGMWRQMRRGNNPQLNVQEMAHILAFLYQAGTIDQPGDQQAGEHVFQEKSCMRCHSVRGTGGNAGPELGQIAARGGSLAWTRAMWNHAQSMIEPITTAIGKWPQFQGAEMNDLIAYVSGGKSAALDRDRIL